jgi:hypothetical protein
MDDRRDSMDRIGDRPSPDRAGAALKAAKSTFLATQANRCGYLRVSFAAALDQRAIVVGIQFTLRPDREWHETETLIGLADLARDPDAAARRAFATLADHIATVGIAQLFRPAAPIGWDAQLPAAPQVPQARSAGIGRIL